jgi:hypothetical protein
LTALANSINCLLPEAAPSLVLETLTNNPGPMIRYRLQCNKKHEFEAWFGSSTAYDRQAKRGQVECPQCGSKKVTKTLMAPGVATRSGKSAGKPGELSQSREIAAAPAEAAVPMSPEAAERANLQRKFLDVMREIRKEVETKAEYVGPRFADEARKIHHEEAEARGIWGEATLEEARELHEDGIDCLPLPPLPEDKN